MDVNVAYSSSNAYAKCTGISIFSLLKNNIDIECLKIYLFTTDMNEENRFKIKKIAHSFGRELTILDVKDKLEILAKANNLPTLGGTYNTYIRMFSVRWLDLLDRVLFIDSDTLIVDSIFELYTTEMGDKLIAATPDAGVYGRNAIVEDEMIVNSCDKYFNAGIVLLNLEGWRRESADSKITKALHDYTDRWWNQEQSILNYVFNERCMFTHLKYNYYTMFHFENFEDIQKHTDIDRVFQKSEYIEASRNPAIIHFVGLPHARPWFEKNISPFNDLYMEYYFLSPWREIKRDDFPQNPQIGYRVYDYLIYFTLKNNLKVMHRVLKAIFGEKLKKYFRIIVGNRK